MYKYALFRVKDGQLIFEYGGIEKLKTQNGKAIYNLKMMVKDMGPSFNEGRNNYNLYDPIHL